MSRILVTRRLVVLTLLVLVATSSFPARAGDGGGASGSVSHFLLCKTAARDVDPAVVQLSMPGDAGQMDGCGIGVSTGKKGVKVEVNVFIHDEDADSDSDVDTDRRTRRCKGRADTNGRFFCTLSAEDFEQLGLNEPLDFAQIEALLKGGKKIAGYDLGVTCSAGTSSTSQ